MPQNEELIGREYESDPDYYGPESMRQFSNLVRVKYRCLRCGHEYSIVRKVAPNKDLPCPKQECKDAIEQERLAKMVANAIEMLETRRAPGILGTKPIVKIIDDTANSVMESSGLTDLKDNLREGDIMAPSLPPHQQKQVDQFFSGKTEGVSKKRADNLVRKAMSGAYRGTSVSPTQAGITAPPGSAVLQRHNPTRIN